MRRRCLTAVVAAAALLVGCGQTHDAKTKVREFMDTQMQLADYDIVEWGRADSTFFVSDSMVQVMRANAAGKVKAQYAKPTPKLLYIYVRYTSGDNDTVKQTFYLDDKMTGIVAYKQG